MFEPSPIATREFFEFLVQNHSLGHKGYHGYDHWLAVLHNGRMLAAETGANRKIVELFALLHDSRRIGEGRDPGHGRRAAQHARELRSLWFEASDHEMELLVEACTFHSDGHTEGDGTVQTCWDADRLDLGRVEIRPAARSLCTDAAKQPQCIEEAYRRSLRMR